MKIEHTKQVEKLKDSNSDKSFLLAQQLKRVQDRLDTCEEHLRSELAVKDEIESRLM